MVGPAPPFTSFPVPAVDDIPQPPELREVNLKCLKLGVIIADAMHKGMGLAKRIRIGRHRIVQRHQQFVGFDLLHAGRHIPHIANLQGAAFPIGLETIPQVDIPGRCRAGNGGVSLHIQHAIVDLEMGLGHIRSPANRDRQQVILGFQGVELINQDQVGSCRPRPS